MKFKFNDNVVFTHEFYGKCVGIVKDYEKNRNNDNITYYYVRATDTEEIEIFEIWVSEYAMELSK